MEVREQMLLYACDSLVTHSNMLGHQLTMRWKAVVLKVHFWPVVDEEDLQAKRILERAALIMASC
jgi:hypothetical protein